MDIQLPDGTILQGVPEGTTKAQIRAKLASKGYDVSKLDAKPQQQEQPQNDPGFMGINNLVRGVGRIPELFDLGEKGGEARGQFAKGAGDALQAAGRGVASIGGQITEDALINAPIAAIDAAGDALSGKDANIARSFSESRKVGDRLDKEQGGAKLVGEVISGNAISKKLADLGMKSWVKQGMVFGGVNSAGDDLARGEFDIGDIASDTALGGIIGGVGEKVAPAIVGAIAPAARFVGNNMARVAAPIEAGISKITGKNFKSAENLLKSLKIEKEGPLTGKTLKLIAQRHGVSDDVLKSSVDEFRAVNGYEPSLVEVADPQTMRKFAMLAYERKSMGGVMRDAQLEQLDALPGRVANSVAQTGPVESGVRVNRALGAAERSNLGRLNEAGDSMEAAARNRADEAVEQANLGAAQRVDEIKTAARSEADNIRYAGEDEAFEITGRAADDAARIRARAADEALNLRDEAGETATDIVRAGDEKVTAIKDEVAPIAARAEGQQKIAREDVRLAAAIDDKNSFYSDKSPLTQWGNRAMRDSGLADKTVSIGPRQFKNMMPPERTEAILEGMSEAIPVTKRAALGAALTAIKEGKEVILSVSDADILRRAFRNAAEDPKYYRLNEAADALETLVGKQHSDYKKFVKNYASLKKSAEQMRKINSVLGSNADVPLLREIMLDTKVRKMVVKIMGKDGEQLLKSVDNALDDLASKAKQVDDIERAAANRIKAAKQQAQDASKEVKVVARDEAMSIKAAADADARTVSDAARAQGRQVRRESRSEAVDVNVKADAAKNKVARETAAKVKAINKDRDAKLKEIRGQAQAIADKIRTKFAVAKQAVNASGNILETGNNKFAASIEGASQNLPLGAVARGSIQDAAGQSTSGAASTVKRLAEKATTQRVASVAGDDTANALEAVGRTQSKAIANMSSVTPQEGFGTKAVSGEIGAALDIAAGLAGRPGPGYIAKLSKGFLGFTRKLGMTSDQATKLAVAVTRRDPQAMKQIIAAVARNGAEQKQLASLVRQAMQSMTNSEE